MFCCESTKWSGCDAVIQQSKRRLSLVMRYANTCMADNRTSQFSLMISPRRWPLGYHQCTRWSASFHQSAWPSCAAAAAGLMMSQSLAAVFVCVGWNGFSPGAMRALKERPPPVISAVSWWGATYMSTPTHICSTSDHRWDIQRCLNRMGSMYWQLETCPWVINTRWMDALHSCCK